MWIKTQYFAIQSITDTDTGTVYQLYPANGDDFPQHITVGDRVIANGDSATRAWARLSKLVTPGNDFTAAAEPAEPAEPAPDDHAPALPDWAVGHTVWFDDTDGYTPVDGGEIVEVIDDDPRGKLYRVRYNDAEGAASWGDFFASDLRDSYVPF